jgi:hypothetical protein
LAKPGSTAKFDGVIEDPGGKAGLVVVLDGLGGKEMKLDIITRLFLDLCGDPGSVGKAPGLQTFDEDREINVAPLIGPSLDLGAEDVRGRDRREP